MHERIEINPAIQHGKPVIRGTRVPVAVLVSLLEGGDERARIAYEFRVTEEDVDAALVYDRIEVDPAVQGGSAIIRGTRVPVAAIIGELAEGMSVADLATEYRITGLDVEAARLYATASS